MMVARTKRPVAAKATFDQAAFESNRRAITDAAFKRDMHPEKIVAEEIASIFADLVRFNPDAKEWRMWSSRHGLWGGSDELGMQRVHDAAIGDYVKSLALRTRKLKPAKRESMLSARYLGAVLRLASLNPALNMRTPFWDADPNLLGTPGATIDLRTGLVVPTDPTNFITMTTRYALAPKGTRAPRWQRFLDEVAEDREVQRFLQQWAGASLRGDAVDQRFVFIHGGGGNGKGVYTHTLARVAGKYHTLADPDLLIARRLGATPPHPTGLAKVLPARMVTASEVPRDAYWNATLLKLLTGGDEIAARRMFENFIDLQPRCSITVIGNYRPAFDGVDDAMRRRFLLLPFEFRAKKKNIHLEQELAQEGPAILRWVVDGAVDWQHNGLVIPRTILSASDDYLQEEDVIARFVDERCEMRPQDGERGEDKDWQVVSTELFDEWRGYARGLNREAGSHTAFSLRIQNIDGVEAKRLSNARVFRGLRLRSL
jgi:putative DNA primase/helicase